MLADGTWAKLKVASDFLGCFYHADPCSRLTNWLFDAENSCMNGTSPTVSSTAQTLAPNDAENSRWQRPRLGYLGSTFVQLEEVETCRPSLFSVHRETKYVVLKPRNEHVCISAYLVSKSRHFFMFFVSVVNTSFRDFNILFSEIKCISKYVSLKRRWLTSG